MESPTFPVTASPAWLFGVLLASLVVFHVLLLRIWKLGRVGWKRVDYLWLGVTAIGLFGVASEIRRVVAENTEDMRAAEYGFHYSRLRDQVRFLSGIAVCRTFSRGEFSPSNLDEIQAEYKLVCKFASELSARLPSSPPADLDRAWFSARPVVTDTLLVSFYTDLDKALHEALGAKNILEQTARAKKRTSAEISFSVMAPLFLVCALALRITKVTGELSLEA